MGLGIGVAVALRVGAGLCEAAGVCEGIGPSARAANAPKLTVNNNSAQIAAISPLKSLVERHVSFMGNPFNLVVVMKPKRKQPNCFGSERG